MENPILLSWLNDFVFCPVSIYFHNLYGETDTILYQSAVQIKGKAAHETIDCHTYSKPHTITGLTVYSEEYDLIGKIDQYDISSQTLIERKKRIIQIFDGHVFQLYGQYYAMQEMGYSVKRLQIHSIDDNTSYDIPLPEEDSEMLGKFKKLLFDIRHIDLDLFEQTNPKKCRRCIYEPACDRSVDEHAD